MGLGGGREGLICGRGVLWEVLGFSTLPAPRRHLTLRRHLTSASGSPTPTAGRTVRCAQNLMNSKMWRLP